MMSARDKSGDPDGDFPRDEFRAARDAAGFAAERAEAALALSRLPLLRRDAATAYDAITAAESKLRALAGQRVAAELSLRAASYRHAAVTQALDAHARAKPRLCVLLATRFRARRDWRGRQALLDNVLCDSAGLLDAARRVITEIQAQFAATVDERAEAVATLRRLTAECAAAQQAVARGRERWGEH
jgi:hypothetical protein